MEYKCCVVIYRSRASRSLRGLTMLQLYMYIYIYTVGAKNNFPLRFSSTYVHFLSVTVGGAFPTVFLSVLRKCSDL